MSSSIQVELSGLYQEIAAVDGTVFPRLREAVGQVAQIALRNWADAIKQAPGVWSEEKNAYIRSLKWEYTGDFAAKISASYQYADEIENGRPSRDLKDMLNTSTKVRRTKTGKRYLIIPFRHNTPGQTALAPAMPPDVYEQAKALSPSRVVGMTQRPSGQNGRPMMVPQAVYQWGDSLPAGLVPKLKPSHATDPYANMYRFDTSSGKQKSSAYLTFRTMVEGSPKWITSAKPGLNLASKVSSSLQPIAEQVLTRATKGDIT